ncbi:MAG: hypothetical protein K6C10_01485 [Prevotella sp.]|nr:hypothetical protein [Prevotella sp.]
MKQFFRFFTLLAIAVVSSTSAWAVEVPTPKFAALEVNAEVYIYHVGTKKFLGWGEAWGTQSCVTDAGLKYILKNKRDDGAKITCLGNGGFTEDGSEITELPQGHYWLYSPDVVGKAGHSVDRWQDGRCGETFRCSFADQSDWDSRGIWSIASVGNNTYTLQVPQILPADDPYLTFQNLYEEGKFAGVDPTKASNAADPTYGLYSDFVYADNPEVCQFRFVTAADMDIYKAKVNLAALIDKASAAGQDVSKYEAIVLDESATLDEIKAAIDELSEILQNLATYKDPTTLNIVNGDCGFSQSMDGWTTSNNPSYENNCWEFWNISGAPYIEQTLANMPAGLYRLKAEAYTRTNMHATLEFGDASMEIVTVGSDVVNNRSQGNAWFNNGNGMNVLILEKAEAGDLTIRLTADNTTGDHWLVWRSFEAQYFGAAETDYRAYTLWATDGYQDLVTDKYYTQSYYDAVENIVNVENEQAMTKEDALAVAEKAKAAMEDLRTNIALLDELVTFLDDEPWDGGKYYDEDGSFQALWEEVSALFEGEITQTNEELQALLDAYKEARQNAVDQWMLMNMEPGTDLTDRLVNPHFIDAAGNSSFTGWTIDSDGGFQNNAGTSGVVEQWNGNSTDGKSIDVWQEIRLMRVGAYRLETKGWYRCDNDQAAYTKWLNGDTDVIGYLYASYTKDKFHNIFEKLYTQEEWDTYCTSANGAGNYSTFDGMYASNGVWAANDLFNNTTDWDMSVDFLSLGEPTKLGILGEGLPAYSWIIWDDFKLTYIGDDLETMKEVAAKEAQGATDILDEGTPMSQEAADALRDCVNQINEATTTEELLEAYKNISTAVDNARKSMANYKRIENALADLNDTMNDTYSTATKEAYDAAEALYDELMAGIDGGTIKDSEIEDVLARILAAKRALLVPANYKDASDDNHIDFTGVIDNARYFDEVNLAATMDGWTNVENVASVENEDDAIGVAEGYGASFDLYQDIEGLPEGTYLVKVDGLYRQGMAANEAKMVQYNLAVTAGKLDMLSEEAKTAVDNYSPRGEMYANGDTKTLARWNFMEDETLWTAAAIDEFTFADADDYYEYVDSLTSVDNPPVYYFPNMRHSFYMRTLSGYYQNEVYCYVGADGNLRIGARLNDGQEGDWVPFTNWRLEYLGEESSHESTTGVREIETEGVIEAVYSVDGRQTNKLQKGLNIVKTRTADGKVVVRKVMVK